MCEWLRVLAALVLCLQCTNAGPVLTQPASISTSLGNTVAVTCTMSGGSMGSYYTSWYWQKRGNAPVYVWNDYDSSRGSGIAERFTGSRDTSRNVMRLTISNVQAADVADYYCSAWDSSAGGFTFGKGTKLSVGEPRAPSVSLLPPSSDQIKEKDKATLVCLVSGFKPGAVEIEWTVDGSVRGNGVETSRIQQETDNTFSVSSYLTLSASDWNTHELYSCLVKHEALANPLKKSIEKSNCI
ncbi:immunoglobulin lambda-1 light chain-like [Carcharodon carcharias]|uniref:immunoglobulin lambda-1 light chain-like n=1 Tax=Carcharodon carcharias TaxID=13397 RepID=UPI001B7E93C3|nr:immunoglobulin lambda-1 light chain-like [Carcharodon carcharias]